MTLTRRSLLAGAFAAGAATTLASCTSSGGDQTSADGPQTIRFSIWFGEGDIEVWKQVIADFQTENPQITVKFEPLEYANYFTKLNTQLAGGSAPDVLGMQFQAVQLGPAGQLAALDPGLSGDFGKIPANLLKIGQTAGKDGGTSTYALPWRFVGASLFGNLDALQKAGVTVATEWTLDDFVSAAKELTGGAMMGTSIPAGGAATAIASTFGAAPVSEDGKTATYNSPEMIAAKTFLRDLVYKHQVARKPSDVSTQKDPFATGAVGMTFQGSWNIPVYRKIKNFGWDILPNPSGSQPAKNYAGPDMLAIYGKSKAIQAAQKFVQYAVFNRKAQELIGTTGAPVLTDYLTDTSRIESEAKLKPSKYAYFVEQASQNGAGWAFVPKFADIGKMEADADFKIYAKADSDIAGILGVLNTQVQNALTSTR